MGELSYVGETGSGCRFIARRPAAMWSVIRSTRGRAHAATLASAYATCQVFEMDLAGVQEPAAARRY
jgi:hypothetical protein